MGRRTRAWYAPGTGPATSAANGLQNLRNRSREQRRNNPFAKSIVDKLVSNIVGTGIRPRSNAPGADLQKAQQALFARWANFSDPEGVLNFYGQQAQVAATEVLGGECFARLRVRRPRDGLPIPLQVQILEPEMCPVGYYGTAGANQIRQGIEFDAIGRRRAYWFYKAHPGDRGYQFQDQSSLTRVPADQVIHVFNPVRPGQIRGVPELSSVLLRLYDADKMDDAALLRYQISNLFAGFITRDAEDDDTDNIDPLTGEVLEDPADDIADVRLEAGLLQELEPGDRMEWSDPPDPSTSYVDFLRQQLRAAGAGANIPFEVFSGDWSGMNDRIARVLLNEFRRYIEQRRAHGIVHQFCRRVWEAANRLAVVSGALDIPGFADAPDDYLSASHIPQAWAYINPTQDVQANKDARRSGFKTRAQILAETTGEDADDVDAQLAEENARADRLGLVLDSDGRYGSNKPIPPETGGAGQ